MLIDEQFLNMVSAQAKVPPRLRMNYNFHQSLDDKCHTNGSWLRVHGNLWFTVKGEWFLVEIRP